MMKDKTITITLRVRGVSNPKFFFVFERRDAK